MRYEGLLLSRTESRALIDEIDCWCRRTGTNYNKIVVAAGVAVTIRHKVRMKDQRVTLATAAKLKTAMRQHSGGINRADYLKLEKPWRREVNILAAELAMIPRINREICWRCGSIVGRCEHTLSANEVRSSFG